MWPFEGREGELAAIVSAFRGSDVNAVTVTAPAGMGKTRLAREAAGALSEARTAWIGATRAGAAFPFGALAPSLPEDEPATGPLNTILAAARQAGGWGGRGGVVVVVDDAHLLDEGSATVVAHLAAHRLGFVIMTVRSGEPLADVLGRLGEDAGAQRIDLPPLPATAIDRLIAHERPAGLDARERRRLHRVAQGNPLALYELLRGARPGGLTDLIMSRLSALDPGTRHAVELVACGEPLPVSMLERLAGPDAAIAAEDAGLIVAGRSGARAQARLGHPLYGEVLRATTSPSRAAVVYGELAGALLGTPLRRREDPLRAALWQVEAGAVSRADIVREGARKAIGHEDLALAERLARAARSAAPGDEADRLLAEILAFRGQAADAARLLTAPEPGPAADRVEWAITRADALYWSSGDIDGALATLDAAGGHPTAEASRSWLLCFDGRCAEAARTAAGVLGGPDAEPRAIIWATTAGAAAAGFLGRGADAEAIAGRGATVAAAHTATVPWGPVEVRIGACLAHLAGGSPRAAEALTAEGYRQALGGGAAMMVSGWALYGGLVALARGHLDAAERLLAEAQPDFAADNTFRLHRCALAARAAAKALGGDRAAATRHLAEADALAHPTNRLFAPWVETWRAWTSYAAGDLPAATGAAVRAADLARECGMPAVEALALYDVARLGGRPDLDRLAAIDHDTGRLVTGAARALVARDGATGLEAAAHGFAERGYDLHAAEVYTAAAYRHHRHGRPAHADLATASAAELTARCPGAATPLLRRNRFTGRLTQRERQILLLAAEHTSAQIAEQLGLALATVNNNLARAYNKLGIGSRDELRTLLAGGQPG
ncbi:AAA family ATPase [Phytohabitans flavus]